MTAINIATQIPSNIVTVEQIHAWSGFLLTFVNPNVSVVETPTRAEQLAQSAIFRATDSSLRLLTRTCLPVDESFMHDRQKKSWMYINEASNVVVPVGFTQN